MQRRLDLGLTQDQLDAIMERIKLLENLVDQVSDTTDEIDRIEVRRAGDWGIRYKYASMDDALIYGNPENHRLGLGEEKEAKIPPPPKVTVGQKVGKALSWYAELWKKDSEGAIPRDSNRDGGSDETPSTHVEQEQNE